MDSFNNSFSISGSNKDMANVLKSFIESSEEVISHYDFVIKDISSTISNPVLETTKGPTIMFLKTMKEQWVNFQKDVKSDLEALENGKS